MEKHREKLKSINKSLGYIIILILSGSTFQSSDGMTGSPFNMEKHREKLKSINKSPGHPLFTSDRRMFDGSKVLLTVHTHEGIYSKPLTKSVVIKKIIFIFLNQSICCEY